MIKKILCPTDFSPASTNAIEYAAKLAQRLSATLTLVHVQRTYIGEGVNIFSGVERESVAEAREAVIQLEDICLSVNKMFKVSCNHEIVSSELGPIDKAIALESDKFDLTVIGTNGIDNLNQLYFGSHSYRVAQKESGPVIIVPEECSFHDIEHMAFASDWNKESRLSFQQLKHFTDIFKSHLHIVHISDKDNSMSKESYVTFCKIVEADLGDGQHIPVDRMIHQDEAGAIENFVKSTKTDLLAMFMVKHGFLYRMFHENIIKKLTSYAGFPILVFHQ